MARQLQTQLALERQSLLEASMLQLMNVKAYADITKDICVQANIPRRTFYHYFESKEDLIDLVIENTMLPAFLAAMFEFDSGYDAMQGSFIRFFRFLAQKDRERLRLLIDNGLESRLIAFATQWAIDENVSMPLRDRPMAKHIHLARVVGSASFFSLLFYWCKNDFRESPEEMAECIVLFLTEPMCRIG